MNEEKLGTTETTSRALLFTVPSIPEEKKRDRKRVKNVCDIFLNESFVANMGKSMKAHGPPPPFSDLEMRFICAYMYLCIVPGLPLTTWYRDRNTDA